MRLWLKKSSEVPLREQLVTQIILGIVSDDLKSGQRLPSTRELARRYRIHANTVSAAYRELARRSWVEYRKGSGIYVRARNREIAGQGSELDVIISNLFKTAREKGYSIAELQLGLERWLAIQPPDHFLLVEQDPELRAILVAEIEQATGVRVTTAGLEECSNAATLAGALPLALYGQVEKVRALLPTGTEIVTLRSRSVSESIRGQKPPPGDALVTVVSRWPDFLRWSRAILVAAGLDEDSLNFADARSSGWMRGLDATTLLITDSLTASQLPKGYNPRVFRILSDASRDELTILATQLGIAR
jgi:GntR family transcriptional regulator